MTSQVRVGIGIFVFNAQNKFILGERTGSHGAGTYAVPGGHLEVGESFEECAAREVFEETALELEHLRFLTAVNTVKVEPRATETKHYVTIFMVGRVKGDAEPKLMEPDKCGEWLWASWEDMEDIGEAQLRARGEDGGAEETLPKRLFEPLITLLKHRPGVRPSVRSN